MGVRVLFPAQKFFEAKFRFESSLWFNELQFDISFDRNRFMSERDLLRLPEKPGELLRQVIHFRQTTSPVQRAALREKLADILAPTPEREENAREAIAIIEQVERSGVTGPTNLSTSRSAFSNR